MPDFEHFLWNDENEEHIAQHGVTTGEFEFVVQNSDRVLISRSSGRPMVIGETESGRTLCCVFDFEDEYCVPVTAFEIE
ncbi:hypothetical protein [Schlesneria paludicola]|uniref:hypothetical protein n=1 Tax=Schlesneria paludicola TaxID=360056 RepID=UPI00029AD888|nr:hypothetical protein [Schlesneria paludicola]